MTGIDIAVGYVFAWLGRKAKRVGGGADREVDRSLDAGMDRLHELVSRKLGEDPALTRAAEEVAQGQEQPSERTRRRLADSLEDAAEHDPGFQQALAALVAQLQEAAAAAGGGGVVASGSGSAIGGSVRITAEDGSAAAVQMRDVTIGAVDRPQRPGPEQG